MLQAALTLMGLVGLVWMGLASSGTARAVALMLRSVRVVRASTVLLSGREMVSTCTVCLAVF